MARYGLARVAARMRNPPGVEPGVTGKERRFQQNRAFGPGPIKPYPQPPPRRRGRYYGVYTGPPPNRSRAA